MTPAEYHERLHACFDARRDPLDDAGLCCFLAERPDELERLVALRERLQALPAAAAARPVRGRWSLVLVAAAAAAVAVLLTRPTPAGSAGAAAGAPAGSAGRVLAASLEQLRPRAHAAVSFTVHQVLAATPTTMWETFELRSEQR
ncbi:MAG TPA: hypothetical protein VK348_13020 [Planctomycetota bacterium]|nr:hypothetical protein [Planctomycetota bacterium]